MSKNKVQEHKNICDMLNSLYIKKNHDYGDSFHTTFLEYGMVMPLIRLEDKFQRLKSLYKVGSMVKEESIKDTLMDLANYAIMTIIELEEKKDADQNKTGRT